MPQMDESCVCGIKLFRLQMISLAILENMVVLA